MQVTIPTAKRIETKLKVIGGNGPLVLATHPYTSIVAEMNHSEARELAMAILALVDKQNPVKAKETTSAGIPEWVQNAAQEVGWHTGRGIGWTQSDCNESDRTAEIAEIILEHAPKDPELNIFKQQEGEIIEQRATIALLTQQLDKKREIIKKLTE